MLGEHGDSQVPAWSSARAGAVPIAAFAAQVGSPITEAVRAEIGERTRNAAYTIVKGKGSTYYGIGAGLARIVGAIRQDEQAVLSVSIVTPKSRPATRCRSRAWSAAREWPPTCSRARRRGERRAAPERDGLAGAVRPVASDASPADLAFRTRSSFPGLASKTATLRAGIENR